VAIISQAFKVLCWQGLMSRASWSLRGPLCSLLGQAFKVSCWPNFHGPLLARPSGFFWARPWWSIAGQTFMVHCWPCLHGPLLARPSCSLFIGQALLPVSKKLQNIKIPMSSGEGGGLHSQHGKKIKSANGAAKYMYNSCAYPFVPKPLLAFTDQHTHRASYGGEGGGWCVLADL
jgi:hypothetical protein